MPAKNPKQPNKGRGEDREKKASAPGAGSTRPSPLPRYDDRPETGKRSSDRPGLPDYGDTEPDDPRRSDEEIGRKQGQREPGAGELEGDL